MEKITWETINKAHNFIDTGNVKYISGNQYLRKVEVDKHTVTFKKQPGRVVVSCSCPAWVTFCNSGVVCSHIMAAETYLVMRNICRDCYISINSQNSKKATRCKSCSKKDDKNGMYVNGTSTKSGPYVMILKTDHPSVKNNSSNYVMEHRLVVEKKLGRFLKPEEVVHHIDGNKRNNDINNLMVFKSSSEHLSFHNRTRNGFTNQTLKEIEERWAEE